MPRLRRRLGTLQFDAFEGPTNEATENPMKSSDEEQDAILVWSEVATEDIRECNSAAKNTYVEPPDDPAADPNVDLHESLFNFIFAPGEEMR